MSQLEPGLHRYRHRSTQPPHTKRRGEPRHKSLPHSLRTSKEMGFMPEPTSVPHKSHLSTPQPHYNHQVPCPGGLSKSATHTPKPDYATRPQMLGSVIFLPIFTHQQVQTTHTDQISKVLKSWVRAEIEGRSLSFLSMMPPITGRSDRLRRPLKERDHPQVPQLGL